MTPQGLGGPCKAPDTRNPWVGSCLCRALHTGALSPGCAVAGEARAQLSCRGRALVLCAVVPLESKLPVRYGDWFLRDQWQCGRHEAVQAVLGLRDLPWLHPEPEADTRLCAG